MILINITYNRTLKKGDKLASNGSNRDKRRCDLDLQQLHSHDHNARSVPPCPAPASKLRRNQDEKMKKNGIGGRQERETRAASNHHAPKKETWGWDCGRQWFRGLLELAPAVGFDRQRVRVLPFLRRRESRLFDSSSSGS